MRSERKNNEYVSNFIFFLEKKNMRVRDEYNFEKN